MSSWSPITWQEKKRIRKIIWKDNNGFSQSVQLLSRVRLCDHGLQHTRLPFTSSTPRAYSNSCPLSQWCHPTISSSVIPFSPRLQSFPASVFSSESVLCIRWQKYWSFSFSMSPSEEYSRLISFRMDCLDLLAVQGTLKSLLQPHSSKAWILWCSAFFIVQLLHPSMTTGKTIALTRRTFVGKVMPLLFILFACCSKSVNFEYDCSVTANKRPLKL